MCAFVLPQVPSQPGFYVKPGFIQDAHVNFNDPRIGYPKDSFQLQAIDSGRGDKTIISGMGRIPSVLNSPLERKVLLNVARQFVQRYKTTPLLPGQSRELTFQLQGKQITLSPVNWSDDGAILRLKINNQPYAMKLFSHALDSDLSTEKRRASIDNATANADMGLFLTCQQVPNIAGVFAANPEEGWMLQEDVSRGGILPVKEGPLLAELVRQGLVSISEIHDKNTYRVQSPDGQPYDVMPEFMAIRFNPGPKSWQDFMIDTAHANIQFEQDKLSNDILGLPATLRLNGVKTLLASPNPKIRHEAITAIDYLPEEDIEAAIDMAVATALAVPEEQRQDGRWNFLLVRTAVRCYQLSTPEAQKQKFMELLAMDEPYIDLGLGAVIPCMPHDFQLQAMKLLISRYPQPVTVSGSNPFSAQGASIHGAQSVLMDPKEYLFEEFQNIAPENLIQLAQWGANNPSFNIALKPRLQNALWYVDDKTRQQMERNFFSAKLFDEKKR